MKTYKTAKIKVEDEVHCDICDHNCTTEKLGSEYAILNAVWGYGSQKDGKIYEIHLCESCFDKTIEWMKKERKKILACFSYPHNTDPLDGESNNII